MFLLLAVRGKGKELLKLTPTKIYGMKCHLSVTNKQGHFISSDL